MKANELRIGNVVNKKFKCGFMRESHTITARDFVSFNRKDYKPIKLTDHIFKLYGFGKCANPNMTESYIYVKDGKAWFVQGKEDMKIYLMDFYPKKRIKYLHQLQNLYFELTGKMLEIT